MAQDRRCHAILGRVAGPDQARQQELAATVGSDREEAPIGTVAAPGCRIRACRSVPTQPADCGVPQSRPNPRGGATLSSAARSSPQSPPTAVPARTPGDCRAGCRATLDTHPEGRAGPYCILPALLVGTCGRAACGTARGAALSCGVSIAPSSLGVSQSHCLCAPLRNESGSSVQLCICAPISGHRGSSRGLRSLP